ncbi:MAG: hypothetical protein D6748_06065, partial [Calditrichaeota bacterium]
NISFDFSRDYQSDAFLKGYRAKDALEAIFTKFDFGVDRRISQRFGTNVSPKLFSWLNTNYRYASNFVYSFDNPEINDRSSTLNKNHNIQLDFKPSTLINQIYSPKQKPRTTRRRRVRNTGKKDADKKEEKKKKVSPPNPAMLLWHMFNSIKSVSVNLTFQDDYRHFNLERTPVWKYQFGFQTSPDAGVDTTFNKILLLPNIRKNRGLDGNIQVDILRSMNSSFKFNSQKVESQVNEQRTQSLSHTIFFTGDDPDANPKSWWNYVPDWRFSLTGVEKFPLFKLFAKTATLEHSRTGKFSESARFEGETKKRDSWSYSLNYQPLLGLTVNTKWNVNGNLRSTKSITYDYRTAGAVTKRIQSGFNLSLSYSVTKGFRLPLPFLKKKRLNNEIQFSLSVDKTTSENFSRGPTDTQFEELDVTRNWKFRPSVSYRFSQKVNGTAFYEQSSSFNKRLGTTTYKEFGINVNIAIR